MPSKKDHVNDLQTEKEVSYTKKNIYKVVLHEHIVLTGADTAVNKGAVIHNNLLLKKHRSTVGRE